MQETYDSSVVATEHCEMYLVTRDELNATLAEDDAGAQHHAKLVKVRGVWLVRGFFLPARRMPRASSTSSHRAPVLWRCDCVKRDGACCPAIDLCSFVA